MMTKEKDIDVLMIEDSIDDLELAEFALLQMSDKIHLRHFRDGSDALDFIYAKDKYEGLKPQTKLRFVILDIGLPTMNGLEVLRKIRSEKTTCRVPVIMLSSSKNEHDIEIAYHLGANSYVVKPNGFDGYMKKIGSLVQYWNSVNEKI